MINNNPCVYKMVKNCHYQDTSYIKMQSDLNLQTNINNINHQICKNCISVRIEQKLFNIQESFVDLTAIIAEQSGIKIEPKHPEVQE